MMRKPPFPAVTNIGGTGSKLNFNTCGVNFN